MSEKKENKAATGERLCVVMPVYNEEAAIGGVLRKWHEALSALGVDFEIRAWNDGSRDNSLMAMQLVADELGPRVVIRNKPNEGHGPTLLRAYRDAADAGFDWIFQVDSDDEMGPERFATLWEQRVEHDFLVGRREGRRQAWPRKLVSWVSRFCVRVFFGKGVWDVNAPYRLMRTTSFRDYLARIPSDTFAPNVILSGLAVHDRLRMLEIAVPQHERTTGEVSIRKWKLLGAATKSFAQTVDFAFHGKGLLLGFGLLFVALGIVFGLGWLVLGKTIRMLYEGTFPITALNSLVSGQEVHDVSHYLDYIGGLYRVVWWGVGWGTMLLFVGWMADRGQRTRRFLASPKGWAIFAFLALLSTVLKFHASLAGWNFDFESYEIVADIVQADGNVYMQTHRYNYGPVWFWILGYLRNLPGAGFRWGIIALLSLSDIGLGAILWRKGLRFATAVFMLSNISIHITGFHNQFDNLAVLCAFGALLLMDRAKTPEHKSLILHWLGVSALGISITLKHVFVFMPFWLLFRTGDWRRRMWSCLIPLSLFGISLVAYAGIPELLESKEFSDALSRFAANHQELGLGCGAKQFLADMRQIDYPGNEIVKNVLKYRSHNNGQFYRWVLGANIVWVLPNTLFFFVAMLGIGWLTRKRSHFDAGLIYSLGMFVFSPAIAMQYYAIPALPAAVYWFPFGLLYHAILGGCFLLQNGKITVRVIPILLGTFLLLGCLIIALRMEIASGLRKTAVFLTSKTPH